MRNRLLREFGYAVLSSIALQRSVGWRSRWLTSVLRRILSQPSMNSAWYQLSELSLHRTRSKIQRCARKVSKNSMKLSILLCSVAVCVGIAADFDHQTITSGLGYFPVAIRLNNGDVSQSFAEAPRISALRDVLISFARLTEEGHGLSRGQR